MQPWISVACSMQWVYTEELLIILHLFNRNSNSNVSTDHHSRNFTVYVRVILELCFGQRFPNSDVSGSGCLWDYISKIITYYWSNYHLGPLGNDHAGLGNYLITIKMQHNTNLQRISQPPRTVNNLSLRCFLQSFNIAYMPQFASFDLGCIPKKLVLT